MTKSSALHPLGHLTRPAICSFLSLLASSSASSAADAVDLYASSVSAINNSAYQPMPNNFDFVYWKLSSFEGGSLVQYGPTTSKNGSTGGVTNGVLYSQNVLNCNANQQTIGVAIDLLLNSTSTVTSNRQTTSSHTLALSGESTLKVEYTPPSTGGRGGSFTQSFTYGTTDEISSTRGSSIANGLGTTVEFTQTVPMNVPPMSKMIVQIVDQYTSYSNVPWSVNYVLTGTLTKLVWNQYLRSSTKNSGGNTPVLSMTTGDQKSANYISTTGRQAALVGSPDGRADGRYGDALASPNGLYAVTPAPNGQLLLVTLNAPNNLKAYQAIGSSYTTNAWSNFVLYPPDGNGGCGWLYSPWQSTSAGNGINWNSNACAAKVVMADDGRLSFINQAGNQTWNSNAGPSNQQAVEFAQGRIDASALMAAGTPVFTAEGTASATLYSGNASVKVSAATPASASDCPESNSSSSTIPEMVPMAPLKGITPTDTEAGQALLPRQHYAHALGADVRAKVLGKEPPKGIRFAPGPMFPIVD